MRWMRWRVFGGISALPRRASETVFFDTPASRAMSLMVTRRFTSVLLSSKACLYERNRVNEDTWLSPSPVMSYSLGIDYGTNSVRALIVDVRDGSEVASAVCDYPSGKQGIL